MNLSDSSLTTKIRFLQQELAQTQEELAELKHLLELNKEIIRTFTRDQMQPQTTTTSTSAASKRLQTEEYNHQLLFAQMQEENEQLYKINDLLTKQRDEARSQALVYEQISESASVREQEANFQLQMKLNEMKKKIEDRDDTISRLEMQLQQSHSKKKIITRQVVSPALETLHMHVMMEQLERKIAVLNLERDQLKEERNGLLVINQMLQNGQTNLTPKSPQTAKQQTEENEESVESDGGDDIEELNDSELQIELPTKIKTKMLSPKAVPKLDLAKAQKVQKLSIKKQEKLDEEEEIMVKQSKLKKQFESDAQKNLQQSNTKSQTPSNANLQVMFTSPNKLYLQYELVAEQLKQCQKELNQCRMSLQDELLTTRNLEKECEELTRRLEDSEYRNEILIQSQLRYEDKWASINSIFLEYYEFFLKHRDKENQLSIMQNGPTQPQLLSPRSLQTKKILVPSTLMEFKEPNIRPQTTSSQPVEMTPSETDA